MFLEAIGVVSGLLYLYLEIKQKGLMWIIGLITAVAYTIIFAREGVYASMAFQIYYVAISIYGFFQWQKDKGASEQQICYRRMEKKVFLVSMAAFLVATVAVYAILNICTDDPMPFADTTVTLLSAMATYWLSRCYREQWLVWVVVNIISVVMYLSLELYFTSVLYLIYIASAVYGYIHWKKRGVQID